MQADKLPPLPEGRRFGNTAIHINYLSKPHYTAEQMRDYALLAIAEASEGLRADAMRWRWFRANGETLHTAPYCYFDIGCQPEELDAAIDAAMAGAVTQGEG